MSLVIDNYQINNVSPTELWEQFEGHPNLFLPASIEKYSFGHYHEITGKRHGFQMNPRWKALPSGPWSVLLETTKRKPAEKITYKISIDREKGLLYTGLLSITFSAVENGTNLLIKVDGQREVELAEHTDEIVETVLRSLTREGVESVNASMSGEASHAMLVPTYEIDEDHMAPLAVAAGVFSAGMALSLWLWRRKKRRQSA